MRFVSFLSQVLLWLVCLWCLPLPVQSQTRLIEIRRSNSTEFSESVSSHAYRLIGDVEFAHEGVIMRCDSAWWFHEENVMDAFGNVYITKVEGENSVVITADHMQYRGNEKRAELWGHVVLDDKLATLRTDRLNYDLNANICYYLSWAEIVNENSTMTSEQGHYHRDDSQFYFRRKVELFSADYKIFTDTLLYNSATTLAEFVGPTRIITIPSADSVYCERGWYNTRDTVALFRRNAWLRSGTSRIYSDTLFLDKIQGLGKALGNVRIEDEKNPVVITGNIGRYNSFTQSGFVTDRAQMIMLGEKDSLYLHADTLFSDIIAPLTPESGDSVAVSPRTAPATGVPDTLRGKSPVWRPSDDTTSIRLVRGYRNVRFFSQGLQGKCDSIAFSTLDSIVRMYHDPVLWADSSQMTAERVELLFQNRKVHRLNLVRAAFVIFQEAGYGYNQLKARNISGFFRGDQELYRINAYDGSNFVYFAKDGPEYFGLNIGSSDGVRIMLEDDKFDEVTMTGATSGIVYPMEQLPVESDRLLSGFVWYERLRPRTREDIFTRIPREAAVSDATFPEDDATLPGEDATQPK